VRRRDDLTFGKLPPRLLPLLVLALGLLATAMAGLGFQRLAQSRDEERFANVVAQANNQIAARLDTYSAVLRSAAGLFAARQTMVTRPEFRAFVDRLDLPGEYPGIQGLGFSLLTPDGGGAETATLLARMGAPEVRVRAAPPGEPVHTVVFLEPMDRRNLAAIGFNMYSEPTRRGAMERARDTGRAAMSGKVELVQEIEGRKQAGFLIYHPVYRGGGTPPTVEGRRADLVGFVYSPFRADDLLAGIFANEPNPRVSFAIYDGTVRPENLLHRSFRHDEQEVARHAFMSGQRELRVAGATWQVVYYTTPGFERGSSRGLALPFVLGGLLATALLTAATWRQAQARVAAEAEVAARRAVESQRELLIAELNHRVKNTLATVQSIAAQTLREGASLRETRESFESRLLALSQAHDLLTKANWRGAALEDLVRLELAPYRGGRRITLDGEPTTLGPNTAVALAMGLHELATNAAKYGSLSTPEGRLRVSWTPQDRSGEPWLVLEWLESGGPQVKRPSRRGFGTRLIENGLRRQLGGEVELAFEPTGVRCRLDVPLSEPAADPLAASR